MVDQYEMDIIYLSPEGTGVLYKVSFESTARSSKRSTEVIEVRFYIAFMAQTAQISPPNIAILHYFELN